MIDTRGLWFLGILATAALSVRVPMFERVPGGVPGGPAAQITAPQPGFKLRRGHTTVVRVRVQPGTHPVREWQLHLRAAGSGDMHLASGAVAISDRAVAQLVADQLVPGRRYTLVLHVEDEAGVVAGTQVGFVVPDPQYTLIPLEPGNTSRNISSGFSMDASGQLVAFGGEEFSGVQLLDATANVLRTVRLDLQGSGEFRLSRDGRRLVFGGVFGRDFGAVRALGILRLDTGAITQGPRSASTGLFTTDGNGRRVAFQSGFDIDPSVGNPGGTLQYFLYDEATNEVRQISNDPQAIDFLGPCSTEPRISADGKTVAFATTATLGVVPADMPAGCRVFAYDVVSGRLRQVIALPLGTVFSGAPHISNDGRWFSFSLTRAVAPGRRLALPTLLDLQTGKLVDHLGGIRDFPSFDSAISGDGSAVVVATTADVDPRVGNADHNMDLFVYDRASKQFTQISETTDGATAGTCPAYNPLVSSDARVVAFSFMVFSASLCRVPLPQRNEADGFVFRRVRAVRRRPGNHPPALQHAGDTRVLPGGIIRIELSATDPDDDAVVFFAQVVGGGDVLPGSRIEDHRDGTATFRWPTKPEYAGLHRLRVAAFDEGGGETVRDLTLAVCSRIVSDGNLPGVLVALFQSNPPAPCRAADLNHDGAITAADVLRAATGPQ